MDKKMPKKRHPSINVKQDFSKNIRSSQTKLFETPFTLPDPSLLIFSAFNPPSLSHSLLSALTSFWSVHFFSLTSYLMIVTTRSSEKRQCIKTKARAHWINSVDNSFNWRFAFAEKRPLKTELCSPSWSHRRQAKSWAPSLSLCLDHAWPCNDNSENCHVIQDCHRVKSSHQDRDKAWRLELKVQDCGSGQAEDKESRSTRRLMQQAGCGKRHFRAWIMGKHVRLQSDVDLKSIMQHAKWETCVDYTTL